MKTQVFVSAFALVVLISVAHGYRDCFFCSSEGAYKPSSKACTEKDPDPYAMNAVRYRDEDECYACYKSYNDVSDIVVRGCLDKDTFKDTVEDVYNFKSTDQCKKNGDVEYCLCQDNLCNGANTIVTSFVTSVLMVAVLKLFV